MAKKKDATRSDAMSEMRDRYRAIVDAERSNRDAAILDLKRLIVPGHMWDERQKQLRQGRPHYEFPILRAHWRQVVNDWRKSRPQIKVRPVEDGDAEGADLRQGLIRNIESTSNAERAYDAAAETLIACGYGAWRVTSEYNSDDGWDQDLKILPIADPLNSVWKDPHGMFGFVEETLTRAEFKRRYPNANAVSFADAKTYGDWFGQDSVRVAEYWRKVPVTKTLVRLSDGRTVSLDDIGGEEGLAQLTAQTGVTEEKRRPCKSHKVIMSICSGAEEIEEPIGTGFDRIPIVEVYANRHCIDGRWQWSGMVRHSLDPQRLLNYAFTTSIEVLAKQPKAIPLVTPRMLEGEGVQAMWDSSNRIDRPYLPFTPDPQMPGGPSYLSPPSMHAAFAQFGQMSIDLIKATTGVHDASLGARSNETSGRAIMARREEGDTATFDYQDYLASAIQETGEILLSALPKYYDAPRAVRVIGKDGAEKVMQLYQEVFDPKAGKKVVVNDLSAGKYDLTVSTGPSFETRRVEFVEMLTQLGQGNPLIAQAVPDLIVGSMDFPKADEAAERLKLLLPPPIQQAMSKGEQIPPEVMAAIQQAEAMMAQAEQMQQALQQAAQEMEADKNATEMQKRELDAARKEFDAHIKLMRAELKAQIAEAQSKVTQAETQAESAAREQQAVSLMAEVEARAAAVSEQALQAAGQVTEALQLLAEDRADQVLGVKRRKQISIVRDESGQIVGATVDEAED